MKVTVVQSCSKGANPPGEELIELWKKELSVIDNIDLTFITSFDRNRADEIVSDQTAVIGAWISDDLFTEEFFVRHPNLRYISTTAHGFGRFDHEAAERHNVTFCNTVYGDETIAQFAMSLLLAIANHVETEARYFRSALEGHTHEQWMPSLTRQFELYGKTIGIIGLGSIGYCMARMASAFGMKVLAYSRHKKEGEKYSFIEQTDLNDLLARSDVLSIHCPLTDETRHLINEERINQMKDGAVIINTARGEIIVEPALIKALKNGKIAAAGLDVVTGEPLDHVTEIFDAPNTIITGHIAWLPAEARYRVVKLASDNFKSWLNGHPVSTI